MDLSREMTIILLIIPLILILTILARNRISGGSEKGLKKAALFTAQIHSNALINYKPFARYEKVLETMAQTFLNKGSKVLIVTTASRSQEYVAKFKEPFSRGDVEIVKITASPRSDRSILKREPGSISEVSVDWLEYLSEVIETIPKKSAVFFEPLSDLILINGFEKTFKFMKKTIDYSTHEGIKVISFLNDEAHEESVRASFEGLFSKIAQLTENEFMAIK